jgi:hypothetical protein
MSSSTTSTAKVEARNDPQTVVLKETGVSIPTSIDIFKRPRKLPFMGDIDHSDDDESGSAQSFSGTATPARKTKRVSLSPNKTVSLSKYTPQSPSAQATTSRLGLQRTHVNVSNDNVCAETKFIPLEPGQFLGRLPSLLSQQHGIGLSFDHPVSHSGFISPAEEQCKMEQLAKMRSVYPSNWDVYDYYNLISRRCMEVVTVSSSKLVLRRLQLDTPGCYHLNICILRKHHDGNGSTSVVESVTPNDTVTLKDGDVLMMMNLRHVFRVVLHDDRSEDSSAVLHSGVKKEYQHCRLSKREVQQLHAAIAVPTVAKATLPRLHDKLNVPRTSPKLYTHRFNAPQPLNELGIDHDIRNTDSLAVASVTESSLPKPETIPTSQNSPSSPEYSSHGNEGCRSASLTPSAHYELDQKSNKAQGVSGFPLLWKQPTSNERHHGKVSTTSRLGTASGAASNQEIVNRSTKSVAPKGGSAAIWELSASLAGNEIGTKVIDKGELPPSVLSKPKSKTQVPAAALSCNAVAAKGNEYKATTALKKARSDTGRLPAKKLKLENYSEKTPVTYSSAQLAHFSKLEALEAVAEEGREMEAASNKFLPQKSYSPRGKSSQLSHNSWWKSVKNGIKALAKDENNGLDLEIPEKDQWGLIGHRSSSASRSIARISLAGGNHYRYIAVLPKKEACLALKAATIYRNGNLSFMTRLTGATKLRVVSNGKLLRLIPFENSHSDTKFERTVSPPAGDVVASSIVDTDRSSSALLFLGRLRSVLDNHNFTALQWLPDGKSFSITSVERLETHLPAYFGFVSIQKFLEKLSHLGFQRQYRFCVFRHAKFLRNDHDIGTQDAEGMNQSKKYQSNIVVDANDQKLAISETDFIPRGVTMRKSGKWQSQVFFAGKSRYIGVFPSKRMAALASDIARKDLRQQNKDIFPLGTTSADEIFQDLTTNEKFTPEALQLLIEKQDAARPPDRRLLDVQSETNFKGGKPKKRAKKMNEGLGTRARIWNQPKLASSRNLYESSSLSTAPARMEGGKASPSSLPSFRHDGDETTKLMLEAPLHIYYSSIPLLDL